MIVAITAALLAHWFADFPIQSIFYKWMKDKSKDWQHLCLHVVGYFAAFIFIFFLAIVPSTANEANSIVLWVALNAVMHGVIDFWTSKATAHYWSRQFRPSEDKSNRNGYVMVHSFVEDNRYAGPFFTVIGFDQFLHTVFLLWSGFEMGIFT